MLIGFGCSCQQLCPQGLYHLTEIGNDYFIDSLASCSAKLPIYALFTAAFFPKYASLVIVALYF